MQQFASGLIKRVGRHVPHHLALAAVRRYTSSMCEKLGAANIEWCIQNGRVLDEFVTAEQLEAMRAWAGQYVGMDKGISNEEFWTTCIPPWTRDLVKANGEEGARWFYSTVDLIRSAFNPETPAKEGS